LDRHRLYEHAVQSPEINLRFCDRAYKRKNGVYATVLREDFCGTALLSAEWVRKRRTNRAIGVDLDAATLRWGKEFNIGPLGDDAKRVKLIRADVRSVSKPRVDVVVAFNFSYACLKSTKDLGAYFNAVRRSLAPGGIFVFDVFGGWEAQMDVTDRTRFKGFTYVWEQEGIDPVTHEGLFHMTFKFHNGGGMKKAFTYDWRLWTLPELRELLEFAGFRASDVYWEGIDAKTNEFNGVFRRVTRAENCPGWNAFIVAS
jgi:SAM-dependent methyltransferase